jgi:hypothetical protein
MAYSQLLSDGGLERTHSFRRSRSPRQNIPRWNLALRIAFRFWMVYLGLCCLTTQIITSLFTVTAATGASFPDPATLWPLRPVIFWTAVHIFHVNAPLSAYWGGNSGSADTMFGWVMTFCLLSDRHCRDRRLVTSRPPPGELRWAA